MVRLTYTRLRPAVAMIELIFALVIMGIVMMSAPMLISTASNSSYAAIQQEGINEASSRINMIMGYAWDENNTHNTYIPILLTESTITDLGISGTTLRRVGTPKESERTFIFSDSNSTRLIASKTLGMEANDTLIPDDIDDFIGNIGLNQADTSGLADYVEKTTIDIETQVSYSNDNVTTGNYSQNTINYTPFQASTDTSNIKTITVILTSTDTNNTDLFKKTIKLQAFSCNIGSYSLEERTF